MRSRERSHFDGYKGDKGAALRKRAVEIVDKQRGHEDPTQAASRQRVQNKGVNGGGVNRNGGTPPAPGVAPGAQQLLRALAQRASKAGAMRNRTGGTEAPSVFARSPSTPRAHTGPSSLRNPRIRRFPGSPNQPRRLF